MLKVANSVIDASRITGVLPVANGGTGVTTSTGTGNTVLSASPTLSGDVNLSTGNLVIGTSGKGIDFSATSSGSGTMTSELLADYEEGTWTPTDGSGAGLSFTVYNPTYTKIGRLVQIEASILWPSTLSVDETKISGLPFTAAGGDDNTAGMFMSGTNVGVAAANYLWQVGRGQTSILGATNSNTGITNANMSGKFVKLCGMYHV